MMAPKLPTTETIPTKVSTSKIIAIAKAEATLEHVAAEVLELRNDIKNVFEHIGDLRTRMTIVENSQKSTTWLCRLLVSSILIPAAWMAFEWVTGKI